jgi:hypothetical protein
MKAYSNLLVILLFAVFHVTLSIPATAKEDPSLVLYFPFSEGRGEDALDASGKENHGVIRGNVKWRDGKYGGALEFDGVSGYVEVPHSESLSIPDEFTIAVWVNPNQPELSQAIVAKATIGDDANYALDTGSVNHNVPNEIRLCVADPGKAGRERRQTIHSNVPFDKGIWQHVAVTWTVNEARFYKNGELAATKPPLTEKLTINDLSLKVGWWGLAGAWFFSGLLDDLKIWNRALGEGEVASSMREGAVVSVPLLGNLAQI